METAKVERVYSKDGNFYSAKIGGVWYGTGKGKPSFGEGDVISFTWTAKGDYRNLDSKSVKVVPQAAAAQAPALTQPAPDKRQDIISRQSAFNTAIALVDLLRAAEAIPGLKKTATADEKYNVYCALVAMKAQEFYHINTGNVLELEEAQGDPAPSGSAAGEFD